MARKKKDEQSGLEQASSFQPSRLRPIDVQQIEFRVSRKGYNETEVDAFLDRVTEELTALSEENKRLREGGALPGLGDPESTAEAQAIIRDARAEAAAIIAAARSGSAPPTGDPLGAIYPFLTKEREFLSRLGEMVRDHMEGIKTDARALQEAGKAAAAAEPPVPEAPEELEQPSPEASTPPAATSEPASSAERAEPSVSSVWEETAGSASPPPPPPAGDVATIPPSEVDTPKKQGEDEPSLRDLFWGDE